MILNFLLQLFTTKDLLYTKKFKFFINVVKGQI
jgi:hypothetical protein